MKYILPFLFISIFAMANENPRIVKVKKTMDSQHKTKNIRKIGSDNDYDYFELTAEELKFVEEARKIFKKSEKESPPSPHLQDKMQDQVQEKYND